MRKKDFFLIAGILLVSALLYFVYRSEWTADDGALLQITVEGEVYERCGLSKDREIPIGDTNVCRIEDGVVRMVESSCPDHLCETQKPIDARGGSIVCLPNRVVLEIVREDADTEIDVISH